MRNTLRIIISTLICLALLSLTSFAANYEHCADALFELGLFRGTDSGYELEREATRAEAATMLVRLLGAEEEALSLSYSAPFNDVADWSKPYIQYLYEKELTKGTSETTFSGSDICTSQQYIVFLLRALGYSESKQDFRYEDALEFASDLHLCDKTILKNTPSFKRDDLCALSYSALAVTPKTGEKDLLTKLISSSAVKDAKGYDKLFENYRSYIDASDSLFKSKRYSCVHTLTTTFVYENQTQISESKTVQSSAFNEDFPEKSKHVADLYLVSYEQGIKKLEKVGNIYYKDGVLYDNTSEYKNKREIPYKSFFKESTTRTIPYLSVNSVAFVHSIDVVNKDNVTVFELKFGNVKLTLTTKDNLIFNLKREMSEIRPSSEKVSWVDEISDIKFGEDVTFDFPDDLDTYELYDENYVSVSIGE